MKENLNKNNLFSKKIDQKDYPSHQPLGLYDSSYEHDACGVGMLVNIMVTNPTNWLMQH